MHHTWISLFFWIVLCCPLAVAAENENSETSQDENTTFKDCVLKERDWKKECSKHLEEENSFIYNPSPPQGGILDNLVPERGAVWGQTPAELFRKLYFPEQDRQII